MNQIGILSKYQCNLSARLDYLTSIDSFSHFLTREHYEKIKIGE